MESKNRPDVWYGIITTRLDEARSPWEVMEVLNNFLEISNSVIRTAVNSSFIEKQVEKILKEKFSLPLVNPNTFSSLFREVTISDIPEGLQTIGWKDVLLARGQKDITFSLISGYSQMSYFKDSILSKYYIVESTEDYLLFIAPNKVVVCHNTLSNYKKYEFEHGIVVACAQEGDQLILIIKDVLNTYNIYHVKDKQLEFKKSFDLFPAYGNRGYYFEGNIYSFITDKIVGSYPENIVDAEPVWRGIDFIYTNDKTGYFFDTINNEVLTHYIATQDTATQVIAKPRIFEWMWFDEESIVDIITDEIVYDSPEGYSIFAVIRSSNSNGYTVVLHKSGSIAK